MAFCMRASALADGRAGPRSPAIVILEGVTKLRVGLQRALVVGVLLASWPCVAVAQWRPDGVLVSSAPGDHGPKAIVGDGAGGAIIAWVDLGSANGVDIYAQHLLASGVVDRDWPRDGLAVCTARGDQSATVMVSDGAGGAIIAWHDFRGCPLNGCGDIYAQHVLATGVVDPSWPSGGLAVSTASGDQVYPSMVSDGVGGAIVAWEDTRGGNRDIYSQHVLASGEVDPAWPANGGALCTAGSGQAGPTVVADGTGGAIVAWTDGRNYDDDVYAQRVLATGVVDPRWPADGLALATGPAEQGSPAIIPDGAGGAIMTWMDAHRGEDGFYIGTYDLFAQHVLPGGMLDPAWPAPALGVCTAGRDQYLSGVVPDRGGGAIVAWLDLRDDRYDIYTQHVLSGGVLDPAWPRDGLPVCTAPPGGHRRPPTLAADATGGATLAWSESRGATDDIYVQHVRGSGALDPAWPADGRLLCGAARDQWNPLIAADGGGRAIVTWVDQRSGADVSVYAQRVYLGVGAPPGRPGPPATFRLHSAQPARNEVTIRFELPVAGPVTVEMFDAAGRAVRTLAERQEMEPGTHALSWDRADQSGAPLRRGVYLVRVSAGARSTTGKVVVF